MDFTKQEDVGESKKVRMDGDTWEAQEMQAQSTTKIEDDEGVGEAAIIRQFVFGANPEAFSAKQPTYQELFNHHAKGIEVMLWRDGMTIMDEITPHITFSKDKSKYRIFVGARPAKGQLLHEKPQTLTEIAHGI